MKKEQLLQSKSPWNSLNQQKNERLPSYKPADPIQQLAVEYVRPLPSTEKISVFIMKLAIMDKKNSLTDCKTFSSSRLSPDSKGKFVFCQQCTSLEYKTRGTWKKNL